MQKGECVFGTFRVPVLWENKILWSIFATFWFTKPAHPAKGIVLLLASKNKHTTQTQPANQHKTHKNQDLSVKDRSEIPSINLVGPHFAMQRLPCFIFLHYWAASAPLDSGGGLTCTGMITWWKATWGVWSARYVCIWSWFVPWMGAEFIQPASDQTALRHYWNIKHRTGLGNPKSTGLAWSNPSVPVTLQSCLPVDLS